MDPYVGLQITDYLQTAAKAFSDSSAARTRLLEKAAYFHDIAREMDRTNYKDWWTPVDEHALGSETNLTLTTGIAVPTNQTLSCVPIKGRVPLQCSGTSQGDSISS